MDALRYQLIGVVVSFEELSGLVRLLSLALAIRTGWAAWLSTGMRRHQS
jgi:hypothetical protein